MKKIIYSLALMMGMMTFTACSSDSNDNNDNVDKYKDRSYGTAAIDACGDVVNQFEAANKVIAQANLTAEQEEYLRQVVELAKAILHPETNDSYPDSIRDSAAKRALFDYFYEDENLTIEIDHAIRSSIQPEWKKNFQKQQKIRLAIYKTLLQNDYTEEDAPTPVPRI